MAVPTVVGHANSANSSTTTNWFTVGLPECQAGDMLIAFFLDASRTIADPAGWTQFRQNSVGGGSGSVTMKYRVADGNEGATQKFWMSSPTYSCCATVVAVRGTDGVQPLSASLGAQTTSSPYAPDLAVAADDTLVFRFCCTNSVAALTITGPSTPANTLVSNNSTLSGLDTRLVYQDAGVAAGQTGTATFTTSLSWPNYYAATIAVAPDASVAPTISAVTVTGTSQIGSTLTASVTTDRDPVDSTTYQWEIADDDSATNAEDLVGETSATLTPTYTDFASRLDANGSAWVRCGAKATKNSLESAEAFSDWQEVTVAAGSGGGGSPLTLPCIL